MHLRVTLKQQSERGQRYLEKHWLGFSKTVDYATTEIHYAVESDKPVAVLQAVAHSALAEATKDGARATYRIGRKDG